MRKPIESMHQPEHIASRIREHVLHAIALNRTPGYHFAGNYFGTLFDEVSSGGTRVQIDAGPHCADSDGRINIGAIALLADVAMGTSVRAGMDPKVRLATSRIHLDFTGITPRETLEAASEFQGFFEGAAGDQAMSQVAIRQGAELVCYGSSAFMVMPMREGATLAPFPRRRRDDEPVPPLTPGELTPQEHWILQHAESLLATQGADEQSFVSRLLGYTAHPVPGGASCVMMNGPHVGNRVGHVQGGLLLGLAAATAQAALGKGWGLTNISACFLRPGVGGTMEAEARIVHSGRLTAVTHTHVRSGGKLLLEAMTTHASLDVV